jgi:hypothetical protein
MSKKEKTSRKAAKAQRLKRFRLTPLDTRHWTRLRDAGYPCEDDKPLEGFYRTYVYDPFGNRIELMETVVRC